MLANKSGLLYKLIMTISTANSVRLLLVDPDGQVPGESLPDSITKACRNGSARFKAVGYVLPWVSYVAFDGDQCVGICAFKTPPVQGAVEIAYMTLEECRGMGIATEMVKNLVEIALNANPSIAIRAQTLPGINASTRVLTKAGFLRIGDEVHPEDGLVSEWQFVLGSRHGPVLHADPFRP